jgi:hypothetical protein
MLLVWYSLFMTLGEASPWYALLIFFSISLPIMPVVFGITMIQSGYRGVVNFILEAWKDFTVEIKPGGVLVEAEV